jgi:hypothetical protein
MTRLAMTWIPEQAGSQQGVFTARQARLGGLTEEQVRYRSRQVAG